MASQGTKSRSRNTRSRSSGGSNSKSVGRRSNGTSGSRSANSRQTQNSKSSGRNDRRASAKTGKYRFAQNVAGSGTMAEKEYESYATSDIGDPRGDPDVLLDVPVVKVDSIHLEVDNLFAHVALQAKVLDLVKLNAGVDVQLGKLRIDIKGVEAQALLKVRLDHVAAIVDRVLTTLDRNPEIVKSLGRTVEHVGEGAGHALGETGEAVEDVGSGAKGAVQDVGAGAGQAVGELGEGASEAVGQVGKGAGQAVGQVGEGAGEAVGDVGEGAGQAVGDVGQGAGQAVGNLDQTLQGVGQTAGQAGGAVGEAAQGVGEGVKGAEQAVGEVGQGAGEAVGGIAQGVGGVAGQLEQAAAGVLTGGGGGNGGGGPEQTSRTDIAKLAAKLVAKELTEAAKEEAKELGLAATRKAKEVGERHKQRKAEELNATEAAVRTANELDVDLELVEGTGPDGRITIRDVRKVQEAESG
jgi:hypothetical protein